MAVLLVLSITGIFYDVHLLLHSDAKITVQGPYQFFTNHIKFEVS